MLLLKDGVKYLPYEYTSEEELTQMVIEHYKEIFGENTLYFHPQTMKTQIGIEARNDGIILAADQNRWYILEVELSKHPLHEHIIPQITRFSIAYEEAGTRRKIINTLYNAIRADLFKTAMFEQQNIEDLHKMLTDLIDVQPTIAIIIDQKTPELEHICKKLPFPTKTIEFKTYARKDIGVGVHIHEFQPLFEKRIKILPTTRPRTTYKERPQKLAQILEVAELVFKGQQLNEAFKSVAKQHGVHESTVRDKCTRQLNINTNQFRKLIQDKNRLTAFLREKYPQHENIINEKLTQF
jgi:hypothetical protein